MVCQKGCCRGGYCFSVYNFTKHSAKTRQKCIPQRKLYIGRKLRSFEEMMQYGAFCSVQPSYRSIYTNIYNRDEVFDCLFSCFLRTIFTYIMFILLCMYTQHYEEKRYTNKTQYNTEFFGSLLAACTHRTFFYVCYGCIMQVKM